MHTTVWQQRFQNQTAQTTVQLSEQIHRLEKKTLDQAAEVKVSVNIVFVKLQATLNSLQAVQNNATKASEEINVRLVELQEQFASLQLYSLIFAAVHFFFILMYLFVKTIQCICMKCKKKE